MTLAIVVAKARARSFIFAMEDLVAFRWELLPILMGTISGFRLGRRRPRAVAWATVCGLAGLTAGVLLGPLLGRLLWGDDAGRWAGGVIVGAIGLVAGTIGSLQIRHIPRHPLITAVASVVLLLGLAGFGLFGATNLLDIDPLEFPEPPRVPIPDVAKVDAVVFLLGDGGATDRERSPLLHALGADVARWSEALKRDSAVAVAYLGDVVYPDGVRDRDHSGFAVDSARLWNQIDLVGGVEATKHASVGFFVTGNHDWGNSSGDEGFDRVINLSEQLLAARRVGRHVSLLPAAGDPGPMVRDLRRNVRIAFFDTHWFLQERSHAQRAQFFDRLARALTGSGDREVILVAHHPYHSAGPHGAIVPGYHTGGIAYLLKQSGALVQDLNSPPYDELLAGLRRTFETTRKPPLIYAGGHDHSLQVLTGASESDPRFVLVSGAGSKVSSIQMGAGLVWGGEQPGYMMLVFRKDDGVDLFVIGGDPEYLACAGDGEALRQCMTEGTNRFEIVYSASLLGPAKTPRDLDEAMPDSLAPGTPWWTDEGRVARVPDRGVVGDSLEPPPVAVPTRALLEGVDSVTTAPGRTYPAGRLRRLFAGDLNRHLWSVPITLPVLDLDRVGGGLAPQWPTGGKQTVGLRLIGRDGFQYDFRPIVKHGARVIPKWIPQKPSQAAIDDQMAAQFPLGALVVAELSEAIGVVAPRPVAVVMPNDERLESFRSVFAGRVGLLTVHAGDREGGGRGFGGFTRIIPSEQAYLEARTDPNATFDDRTFLRARLLDFLVGDWDRHSDQWQWGRRRTAAGTLWVPIPEDRDWALSRIDGLVGGLSRWLLPSYVGFSDRLPPVSRLAASGDRVDHRVLNRLGHGDFLEVASEVQSRLTDSVIAAAVGTLPLPYLALEQERLVAALKARRDQLFEYSEKYYRLLARTVQVYGFDRSEDQVELERISKERVRVRVRTGGAAGPVRFERLLDGRETKRLQLFIDPAQDHVVGADDLPFDLEIVSPPLSPGERPQVGGPGGSPP